MKKILECLMLKKNLRVYYYYLFRIVYTPIFLKEGRVSSSSPDTRFYFCYFFPEGRGQGHLPIQKPYLGGGGEQVASLR